MLVYDETVKPDYLDKKISGQSSRKPARMASNLQPNPEHIGSWTLVKGEACILPNLLSHCYFSLFIV